MHLTPAQFNALAEQMRKHLNYYDRLEARLVEVGVTPDDKLLLLAKEVKDRIHHLSVHVHYRACNGAVGRKDNNH